MERRKIALHQHTTLSTQLRAADISYNAWALVGTVKKCIIRYTGSWVCKGNVKRNNKKTNNS
jgi:hypothetical protein